MQYPAKFEPAEEGGYVVTFRDIPEAITQGDDEAEAADMAADALLSAIEFYFEDNRPVPMPSALEEGERLVNLPLSVSAKVLLLNEVLAQGVTYAEVGRRIGFSKQDMQRVTNIHHATKIDTIAQALAALGKRLDVVLS